MPSPSLTALWKARALVRGGQLGCVRFCRIANEDFLPAVKFVLGPLGADCLISTEAEAEGAALLGSRATLAISGGACRIFAVTR